MNKIISRKFGKPIIFEYVIDELFTLMINKQPFSYIEKVIDLILQDVEKNIFQIITLTDRENSLHDIIRLFKKINEDQNRKKKLSFTDCAILFAMIQNDIFYLASFDSGFDGILEKIEDGIYALSSDKILNLKKIL
jgi:predicted nucleic acid-binding protein